MKRSIALLTTVAAALFVVFVMSSQAAVAQPQSLLTHHVQPVILNGQAPFVGKLPANQSMRIDIVLAVRDQAGLDRFLQDVYDPSSASYHQFLTVEQFTQKFGPSQADYDALVRFAGANGLTMTGGSRDAMDVQFKASVATIETAFHMNMGLYHDANANRDFYSPDREPTIDLPFQLWHITGLDNYSLPRPLVSRRPPNVKPPATTGSCPGTAFCGSDMRAAYYQGTALTGKGQNIGLLEWLGFDIADVNTYYKNAKQKRTAKVIGISTDGSPLLCLESKGCDDTEQTIDITQALGMAPGVTAVYLYVSNTSDTAMLGSMSSHKPLPLNLSSSWYWNGPIDPKQDDPYFKKFAAQGQSFFEAAGDSGHWVGTGVWWPMESPYVISVGGTDLVTKGAGKGWASETVWSPGGGGISPDKFPIPSWQKLKGVITKANEGSTKYRNGPDVSANSNYTFYVCADQRACTSNEYGGTSFAAPMWAGYLALTNQQAAAHKDKAPGFINPTIYPLGLGKGYATAFHDITVGSNGFPATKGYDLATGWGSPNTDGLINALAK
jgi:kumamolisin